MTIRVGDLVEIDSVQHGVGLAIVLDIMGEETSELDGFYEIRLIRNGNHVAISKAEIIKVIGGDNGE